MRLQKRRQRQANIKIPLLSRTTGFAVAEQREGGTCARRNCRSMCKKVARRAFEFLSLHAQIQLHSVTTEIEVVMESCR